MNFLISLVMVIGTVISCANKVQAQWVSSNGPFGGAITALMPVGPLLYAGTQSGGVWLSSNNGVAWTKITSGVKHITGFAVRGTTLFAATDKGVFFTDDQGATWHYAYAPQPGNVLSITIVDSIVIVGTGNQGMFWSTDHGSVWSWTQSKIESKRIRAMAFNSRTLFAATYDGVFVSSDSGRNWKSHVPASPRYHEVTALSFMDSTIFVASSKGVFRINSSDEQWTDTDGELAHQDVRSLFVSGIHIFAGTTDGVRVSTDHGLHWMSAGKGMPSDSYVSAFALNDSYLFVGCSDGNVYRSGNNGTSWDRANSGLANTQVNVIAGLANVVYAGTDGAGVFRSVDHGYTWTSVNVNAWDNTILALEITDAVLFAGTYVGGIYKSTDAGRTWKNVNTGITNRTVTDFVIHRNEAYASTYKGVFKSSDDGETWSEVSNGLTNTTVSVLAADNNALFAGTSTGIFRSTNSGKNWTLSNKGLPLNAGVHAFLVTESGVFAASWRGMYYSSNGGTSWSGVYSGLANGGFYSLSAHGGTLFAGSTTIGMLQSITNGNFWTPLSENLGDGASITTIAVIGSNLYAGVKGIGVVRRPLDDLITSVPELTTQGASSTFSEAPSLYSFPNPFTDHTTIEFTLQHPEFVSINIFNIAGEKITTLLSEHREVGPHSVQFDVRGLAGGTYYVQLQCGGGVHTYSPLVVR
ncbi:MAG: T9SS type A sorting domain-containing protein [bacterium]|nr:T9SS type A sorting domain-containing protein [bacterium]